MAINETIPRIRARVTQSGVYSIKTATPCKDQVAWVITQESETKGMSYQPTR